MGRPQAFARACRHFGVSNPHSMIQKHLLVLSTRRIWSFAKFRWQLYYPPLLAGCWLLAAELASAGTVTRRGVTVSWWPRRPAHQQHIRRDTPPPPPPPPPPPVTLCCATCSPLLLCSGEVLILSVGCCFVTTLHPGQCGLCLQPHGGGSEGHKIYYLESRFTFR